MIAQDFHKNDSLWKLDDIPSWINENIKFPNEAYQCGMAGIEQFVISATWDGRVFITSGLNTLNPAYEEEIKNVVSRAPKCRFSGNSLEDIYKLVKIDFSALIPDELANNVQCIGRHLPPCFALRGQKIQRLKGREQFVKWLSSKFRLPHKANLVNYNDTVTLYYTISEEGKIENVNVMNCSVNLIKDELIRIMNHSPRWKPAVTDNKVLIPVLIKENVVISVNENGDKNLFDICIDEVCQNSKSIPLDPEMLILNPEVQHQYAGSHKSLLSAIHDSLIVDKRVKFVGSFIVEKNGKVSNIYTASTDVKADSVIKKLISQSKWIPAKQGGKTVRSIYAFTGVQLPPARYMYDSPQDPPKFMREGKLPPFSYDPSYNKSQMERWNYFRKAYPEVDAVIHGYNKFRYLNSNDYKEALMIRGFPLFNLQKRAVRNK